MSVHAAQEVEFGRRQSSRSSFAGKDTLIGRAPDHGAASAFREGCRRWHSDQIAELLRVEADGAIYSRVGSVVSDGQAESINLRVNKSLLIFLAGMRAAL